MWNVARHHVQQVDGIVARTYADMDMLAEHGELLGQVSVHLVQVEKTLLRKNALFAPVLERMRAASGDPEVQAARVAHDGIANRRQLGKQALVTGMHPSADLDHAF